MLPFSKLRVVDLTEALAGPYCSMLMGDLGADVIKIERPGSGDQSRRWGAPLPGGESAYFCATNRNKRSLSLNIRSAGGQRVMQQLMATADVFVCNIPRDDSLRRAGLDAPGLRAAFPRLIYASITGYGRSGPNAGRSGYDLVTQGEAGLMSVTGTEDSAPIRFPIPIADMTTGLYTVIGVLAALRARDQTGQGQLIDLSLLESQAAYLTIMAGDYFASGQPPRPIGNTHPGIVPYQVFHAADKDVIIAVGSDRQWAQLCEVLALGPEVRDDPRFATNPARLANRTRVVEMLQSRLARMPAADLLARLQAAEIPCGPINAVPDSLSDVHYLARGNIVEQQHATAGRIYSLANPVRLSDTPATYRLPPPRLGEHTDAILDELGFSTAQIDSLRQAGDI
jgi:crotonobetainyl-CoA:carnitine CoA-transferase CaiB-like acyl-CoA transferase